MASGVRILTAGFRSKPPEGTQTALKDLRFETLDEAKAYLDRWDARWADTRIHGTKRQVAAMFTEERSGLQPLPLEAFRYCNCRDGPCDARTASIRAPANS
jgi:hypothetical protein